MAIRAFAGQAGFPTEAVREMIASFRYVDEVVFEWGGKLFEAAPGGIGPEKVLPPAVREVTHRLYQRYYCAPDPGRGGYTLLTDDTLRREHTVRLDEANTTRWGWQTGWRVVSLAGPKLVLAPVAGGSTRTVPRDEFDGPAEPGARGRLRLRKGSGKVQPPWYHVRGETDHHEGETLRVYWNVSAAGAIPLVRALTNALNEAEIPFHFKIMSDPERFTRADVAVLYLDAAAWDRAKQPIRHAYAAAWPWIKDATPLFAWRLARGLAAAEDPPNDSFGLNRTRYVATALWQAHLDGARGIDASIARVREAFVRAGFDPDRLHLQPGSRRSLELDIDEPVLPFGRSVTA